MKKLISLLIIFGFVFIYSCGGETTIDLTGLNYDEVFQEDSKGITYYKKKLFTGKIVEYVYAEGPLLYEINYLNGKKDGIEVSYFENGNVKEKFLRRNDSLISYDSFYINGTVHKSLNKYGKIIDVQKNDNGRIDTLRYHLVDSTKKIIFPLKGKIDKEVDYVVKLNEDTLILETNSKYNLKIEKFLMDKDRMPLQVMNIPTSNYYYRGDNSDMTDFSYLRDYPVSIFSSTYNKISYKEFRKETEGQVRPLLVEEGKYKNGIKHGIWKEYEIVQYEPNEGLRLFGIDQSLVYTSETPINRERDSFFTLKYPSQISVFDNGDLIEETLYEHSYRNRSAFPTPSSIHKKSHKEYFRGTTEGVWLNTEWDLRTDFKRKDERNKYHRNKYYVTKYSYSVLDYNNPKETKDLWSVYFSDDGSIYYISYWDKDLKEWIQYYQYHESKLYNLYNESIKKTLDSILKLQSINNLSINQESSNSSESKKTNDYSSSVDKENTILETSGVVEEEENSISETSGVVEEEENSISETSGVVEEEENKIRSTETSTEKDLEVDIKFSIVENVPVFPGCEGDTDKRSCFNEMIQEHIRKNLQYPEIAKDYGIQGRVTAMFMIQKDGNIGNIRLRGPDKNLETEALRIIEKLPKMTPGKHWGRLVNVPYSVPINFKLN